MEEFKKLKNSELWNRILQSYYEDYIRAIANNNIILEDRAYSFLVGYVWCLCVNGFITDNERNSIAAYLIKLPAELDEE